MWGILYILLSVGMKCLVFLWFLFSSFLAGKVGKKCSTNIGKNQNWKSLFKFMFQFSWMAARHHLLKFHILSLSLSLYSSHAMQMNFNIFGHCIHEKKFITLTSNCKVRLHFCIFFDILFLRLGEGKLFLITKDPVFLFFFLAHVY